MRFLLSILFAIISITINFTSVYSQEKPPVKISGMIFGDYFYKVQGDSAGSGCEYSSYHKDQQAFDLRRILIGFDHDLSENFSAGIALEGSTKFLNSGRVSVILKVAYLEWKNIFPGSSLLAGYFPTPACVWGIAEKMWGYRSIERTITDQRGTATPVDIGVGLKGSFDKKKNYGYFIMIGNGTAARPENNRYKNFYASVNAKPVENLNIEAYTEFEPAAEKKNKIILKGIIAYQRPEFTIGTETFTQIKKNAAAPDSDINVLGISVFSSCTLLKNKKANYPKLNAFARYDLFDPDTKNDSLGYRENFITAGLDFMPAENIHFMPNIWINSYAAKNPENDRKADIVGRMTFYFIFK